MHLSPGMIAIISLLTVLVVSLAVVRVATVALTLTGLSRELARFQARSAFTGSGFTTAESERVVQHPVRRRIIMLLMLLGSAGLVTAMSTMLLSFLQLTSGDSWGLTEWLRILFLFGGLAALWMVAHSQWVDDRLSRAIGWALTRWTNLDVRDYAGLLHLTGDYVVAELAVTDGDWLEDQPLRSLRLDAEGVLVLGVERPGGEYVGVPRGETNLVSGDALLLYGRRDALENLDVRPQGPQGNWEHHKAVERQMQMDREEADA
ncbi:TrkA C-terminal domain-containing protein [Maioricimonas sp. JC845]|uniref:TrkA C-terminal domain-containing protein n=1 Tax=Maioricimonas sp. JC845 TaxID=3232138 RepID=UPI0034589946